MVPGSGTSDSNALNNVVNKNHFDQIRTKRQGNFAVQSEWRPRIFFVRETLSESDVFVSFMGGSNLKRSV